MGGLCLSVHRISHGGAIVFEGIFMEKGELKIFPGPGPISLTAVR
jgi:hypothetical protein